MGRLHVMSKKRIAEQKGLNKAAKIAIRKLSQFKDQNIKKLKPLMWNFDYEVLLSAINLVQLELRNQTLTMK